MWYNNHIQGFFVRRNKMGKYVDLTGKQFGRLKVIHKNETKRYGRTAWVCKCQCGNTIIATTDNLNRGNTTSCGCKRIETCFKQRKRNEYKFDYEQNIGYCYGLYGHYFVFDLEDYDKIKDYTWSKSGNGGHWYFKTSNQCLQLTHVLLPEVSKKQIIDHIDRNPDNNCKSNLRIASKKENSQNINIPKNNTTGIIGVSRFEKNRWRAYITVDGKQFSLGCFDDKEDAIKARLQGELKYFGEFAPQSNLFKKYNIEVDNYD